MVTRGQLDLHRQAVSLSDYQMNRDTVDKLSSFPIELRTHEQEDSQLPTHNHLDTQHTQRELFFNVQSQTHRMSPFGRNTFHFISV